MMKLDRALCSVRTMFVLFGVGALLLLSGCDQQALVDRLTPTNEGAIAKQLLAEIAASKFDQVEPQLDPKLRDDQLVNRLKEIATQFPTDAAESMTVLGSQTLKTAQFERFDLTFEYAYPDKWLWANVLLERREGKLLVLGIHVNSLPEPLEKTNRFTLSGKGPVQYIFLVFAMAVPIFVLATLVICIRTRISRRKWAWVIFVSLGLTQLSLNWTTGQLWFSAFYFSLLGGGFSKAIPAAPAMFHVGVPLGAIIFLLRRKRLASAQSTEVEGEDEDSPNLKPHSQVLPVVAPLQTTEKQRRPC